MLNRRTFTIFCFIFQIAALFLQSTSCLGFPEEDDVLSAWAEVVPNIDGKISYGEWDDADSITLSLYSWETGKRFNGSASLYVKNNQKDLFFAIIIFDDFNSGDVLSLEFDNNGNGLFEVGEDRLVLGFPSLGWDFFVDHFWNKTQTFWLAMEDRAFNGTNDGEGYFGHSNPIPNETGEYVFEISHPLNSHDDSHDFSLSIGDVIGIGLSFWDNEEITYYWPEDYRGGPLEMADMARIKIARGPIIIDRSYVSDNICDVGSQQFVYLHVSWNVSGPDVTDGIIYVNETAYYTNTTGWISFIAKSQTIGAKKWIVTGVDCDGFTYFKQEIPNTVIVWDQVEIMIKSDQRLDVSQGIIEWVGKYIYLDEPFQGTISLNDTSPKNEIGDYGFRVTGIHDSKYGLNKFTAREFRAIFDKVIVEIALADDRIDVGDEPDIDYSAFYAYDYQPFYGQVIVGSPTSLEVGVFTYTVEGIIDPQYSLTAFSSNEVTCIWDRVKIVEGGVSKESTSVGNTETVWFKAVYEYDNEVFDSSKGVLYVNDEPIEFSSTNNRWEKTATSEKPVIKSFEITGVEDNKYGLTALNDVVGSLSIQWRSKGIPGFPYESIVLGVALGILLLWMRHRGP